VNLESILAVDNTKTKTIDIVYDNAGDIILTDELVDTLIDAAITLDINKMKTNHFKEQS
jgi:hypothetical protein